MSSNCYSFYLLLSVFCLGILQGHAQTPVPINENFRALTLSGSRIVGLDYGGRVWGSDDGGATFSDLNVVLGDTMDIYYALSAVGDTVIAVGTDGLIARSTDRGDQWTQPGNAEDPQYVFGDFKALSGRAGGNPGLNQWIVAGDDGDHGVVFSSDDDGGDWTKAVRIGGVDFAGATWSGSVRIVCGKDFLYEGVIYRSVDGTNWVSVVLPLGTLPLLALAADGNGSVLAVGEGGIILHSSDHGLTFQQISGSVSEDLHAVVAIGEAAFLIGGEGKSLFRAGISELTETMEVEVIKEPAGGAPPVETLLATDSEILLGGAFSAGPRNQPFQLQLEVTSIGYRLTVNEALSGKAYSLETSTTLQDWSSVSGSAQGGLDAPLEWNQPKDGTRRFWRVTEF